MQIHGGIFMRSVCKVFEDSKYVLNHKFGDIIFKIKFENIQQQIQH